jgi:Na+-driven multidrug efflux pump
MVTKENHDTLSTIDGLREICKLCIKPIVGMLFYPIYSMINAAYCGRFGRNELAGFGLGSLSLGILAISLGCMFSVSARTLMAQAFGEKDMRMVRVYLNRQYFLNTLIFPVIVLPLLFIRQIYAYIG